MAVKREGRNNQPIGSMAAFTFICVSFEGCVRGRRKVAGGGSCAEGSWAISVECL